MLCQTYDQAPFDERGRKRNRRRVLQLLSARLRVEDALRRHPEIRQREIRRPMVLTGLPRSGTSALFNLLAADPVARPLLLWETQLPDPAVGLAPGQPDPRHLAVKAYYEQAHQKNPEFTKIHYASADTPEECVLLQALTLNGVHYGVEPMLEPYASWYRKQDLRPMYRYYRALLQMLDWQRPGERWLLKAPAHMWAIDALIETFPDVSIVWSHRDPLLCIASVCSMTYAITNGALDDVEARARPAGVRLLRDLARARPRGAGPLRRGPLRRRHARRLRRRSARGGAPHLRPLRAAALRAGRRRRMQAHVGDNPKGKHGSHAYALEEWGLSADAVRERFTAYIERFRTGRRRGVSDDPAGKIDTRAGVVRVLRAAQEGRRHASCDPASPARASTAPRATAICCACCARAPSPSASRRGRCIRSFAPCPSS